MPRPVPPPPPQPSADETVRAVAYLHRVVLAAVLFFAAWVAVGYGPDHPIGQYGRVSAQSWMRWGAATLDESELRTHPGGKVVWLVGSSILREAIDADAANAALAAQGSEWRVAKFSQDRGATALAGGLLRYLPVRSGDVVVHNVAVQNFRSDWLAWTDIPMSRLARVLSPAEMWGLAEQPLPARLEQAAAFPPRFWRWHDETRRGITAFITHLIVGEWPAPARPRFHFSFHTYERGRAFRNKIPTREFAVNGLEEGIVDFSDSQVNAAAIQPMRDHVREAGATLHLLDLPPSAWAQWNLQGPQTRAAWDTWRAAQAELVYGPQLPEADFYDRRHPNFRGRATLTAWLVDWLESGRPAGVATRPSEDQAEAWPWESGPGARALPDTPTTD